MNFISSISFKGVSGSGINTSILPRPVFRTDPQQLFTNVGYQEGHSEQCPTIKPGHGPQISNRRMGKDDKLAKEANLPFSVKVIVIMGIKSGMA